MRCDFGTIIAMLGIMASMSHWPARERPRERLHELGPSALSDAELLALILGTGSGRMNVIDVAHQILAETGGLDRISSQGLGAISRLPGMGKAKGARVVAALELGVRVVEQTGRKALNNRFECSMDIFDVYKARLGQLRKEVFIVVGLNSKNEAIKELTVAEGSVKECYVEPIEVFRPLIIESATRAILIHNHPSGDSTPSPHDVAITRRLAKVGDLLGIMVLDHVVIGHNIYSSLRDLGLFTDE
ncbi:MAG: DNA repair protein RadC [Proteobacteria bacterium]|nr:DNA repair protein RadC [Pseudomonadota bacterium]